MKRKSLRIATRKSPLAMWQANWVKQQLAMHYPDVKIEFIRLVTEGDKKTEVALNQIGGKSLFVKELQAALLSHEADLAVHSLKDLSVFPCLGLMLAAVCLREDPRDVLIANNSCLLSQLPVNAIVGTSSPRRQFQLKAIRPDIIIKPLRGNIETRLAKLDRDEYSAIVLACAGLKRLGLENRIQQYLDPQDFIPAIGQGALGIEIREDDPDTLKLVSCLNHWETQQCVTAERAVNQFLGGDCYSPIGAYAKLQSKQLFLQACFGDPANQHLIRAEGYGPVDQAEKIGRQVGEKLFAQMA
ncbi:MAG: hydroxymethylbilane synthase [Proteobacteria bacterium]|nr:hydroxymethylbilane synthase [Pseudomonadota bacterium]